MKIHERHFISKKAELELCQWFWGWIERTDLTHGEIMCILATLQQCVAVLLKREERHPDDPDKKADEA